MAVTFIIPRLGHCSLFRRPQADRSQRIIGTLPPLSVRKAPPCERAEASKHINSVNIFGFGEPETAQPSPSQPSVLARVRNIQARAQFLCSLCPAPEPQPTGGHPGPLPADPGEAAATSQTQCPRLPTGTAPPAWGCSSAVHKACGMAQTGKRSRIGNTHTGSPD